MTQEQEQKVVNIVCDEDSSLIDDEEALDPVREKFKGLEDELNNMMLYVDTQITSIDEYEVPLKANSKFVEGIFKAKQMMIEQKLKAIQSLFAIYVESRKGDEEKGKGRDVTDFLY